MARFKSPFTATPLQVSTYLLGVALFSISFLVFLNASVSFVITDLIGQSEGVGDAVGTLGFADELVALVACPVWGLLSDKLGVRMVCVLGYTILGISLFVFVQASNVYPQLLLARIFFSVGGAATSTMVTAVLPTMTFTSTKKTSSSDLTGPYEPRRSSHVPSISTASEATVTPERFTSQPPTRKPRRSRPHRSGASQVAGLVGSFTGLGALLALGVFLPLPARLSNGGQSREQAVMSSFYIVGAISLVVGIFCFVGLRNLTSEEGKGWRNLLQGSRSRSKRIGPQSSEGQTPSTVGRLSQGLILGFTDLSIGLGYIGGFVARASSVGISLFIPLYVNAYFIRTGLCPSDPSQNPSDPSDVKAHCRHAYTLAAALTGVSQVVALVCAPAFGWLDGRFGRYWNAPLVSAALAGIVGYVMLANLDNPEGNAAIWVSMVLLGVSQIGAIVCSLSLLSRGIEGVDDDDDNDDDDGRFVEGDEAQTLSADTQNEEDEASDGTERSALIPSHVQSIGGTTSKSRSELKGTIAGLYSFSGGAGILLLTKLGGYLFDRSSPGAPFYMLAVFNGILFIVALACSIGKSLRRRQRRTLL